MKLNVEVNSILLKEILNDGQKLSETEWIQRCFKNSLNKTITEF